eukprot:TRINITY_DN39139_c0_g1_i1.p1 TRINITY_DN39139_c0_g1~~TRINITY_DN39139_c0_g1_i1.p1  ORF type:complete len:137 (-),score=50.67 TRINITY_DN39139_c0_g1_i1:231-641(-)
MPTIEITVTSANCKKLDCEAYGVTPHSLCHVVIGMNGKEFTTQKIKGKNGVDPVWEEAFNFDVNDEEADKFYLTFFIEDKQIGLKGEYGVSGLKKMNSKYRGHAVPGGKVDLMLKPIDFGIDEESEEEDDTFLDML